MLLFSEDAADTNSCGGDHRAPRRVIQPHHSLSALVLLQTGALALPTLIFLHLKVRYLNFRGSCLSLLLLLTVNALNKWFYSRYFLKSSDTLQNCSVFQVFRIKFEFLLEASFPENLHSLWYHFTECLYFSHMVHVENDWSQTGEHWKKQRCEVDGATLQKSEFLFGSVVPTSNWPKFSGLTTEKGEKLWECSYATCKSYLVPQLTLLLICLN